MKVIAKKRKEIIELRKQGKTYQAISLFTGIDRTTVSKVIREQEIK